VCAKDRHGTYARGEHVADFVWTVTPQGTNRVDLYAPGPDAEPELPALLASRNAVEVAKSAGRPLTLRELVSLMTVKARKEVLYAGIEIAVAEGRLDETTGPRHARVFTFAASSEGAP
jgi:hypothetical protein